ncbi:MAG: hypothetical protein IMY72_05930 [Bacteroidetes bacterium]|nr:hypothetical protein [Bacteroidota bacterium]
MNSKYFQKSYIIIIIFLILVSFKFKDFSSNQNLIIDKQDDKNKKEWAKVDSLEKKGLPKSALKIVDGIYKKSKKTNNSPQFIKALTYKLKLINQTTENGFDNLIIDTKKEAQLSTFPNNAILNSMLSEMYYMYYQANRWKFYKRSQTVNFDNKDLSTWDLNAILEKIIYHYKASLSKSNKLQLVPINKYDDIIIKGDKSKNVRPTLYDFLAFRAVDFFSKTELSVIRPADMFQLKENFYFDDANLFAKKNITTTDTLSLHFYAINILQDLLNFRLKNNNEDALIDVDLKRLTFAYKFSVNEKKDSLYISELKKLHSKYQTNPYSSEISYLKAQFYNKRAKKYNSKFEETSIYKFDNKTAFDICNRTINKFPKTNGAEKCKNLKSQIERKDLTFNFEKNVVPGKNFAVKTNYQNETNAFLKIVTYDKEKINNSKRNYSREKLYDKYIKNAKTIWSSSINMPKDNDLNSHSLEFIIDKLNVGQYVLIVADNKDFSYDGNIVSFDMFTVTNLSYIKRQKHDGTIQLFVLNRTTGKPIGKVNAQIFYRKYNYKTRKSEKTKGKNYISDKQGFFEIEPSQNNKNFTIDFSYNNDYLSTNNTFYSYKNSIRKNIITRTFFFTDRAIYRPGQTVHFKGIVIENDGDKNSIIPNYSSTIMFKDVNYKNISKLNLKTNEFGTFSGSFQIPQNTLNGLMQIRNNRGSVSFSVEEYKRPKFFVKFNPLKGNYLLNNKILITGFAKSYAGSNLTNASVKYTVERTPLWDFKYFYPYINSKKIIIKNGVCTTNSNGEFKIEFTAIPDLSVPKTSDAAFNYNIIVDVTDINGETQSADKNISVAYNALKVDLDIPEKLNKEKYLSTKIITQNYNNEFIPAKGDIKIYRLKEPEIILRNRLWEKPDKFIYNNLDWDSKYPNNIYKDEKTELEKLDITANIKFDTKKNEKIKIKNINKWESGKYLVEIFSTDLWGNKIVAKKYFTLYSPNDKKVPFKTIDWFHAIKDKGEPGENAVFVIGTSLEKINILYDIESKNKIISSKNIQLKNNQQTIKIPITENFRGNFSVHFTFIYNNRIYKHNALVTVPYTNKKLDFEFSTFKNKLLPGESEEWKIKIKNNAGEKIVAEMMADLYDASLDKFKKNIWNFNIYKNYYSSLSWETNTFYATRSNSIYKNINKYYSFPTDTYNRFNWFGFNYYRPLMYKSTNRMMAGEKSMPEVLVLEEELEEELSIAPPKTEQAYGEQDKQKEEPNKKNILEELNLIKARTNFNETAFFYPNLKTDDNGDVTIKFTMPDALTKWRLMCFSHTKNLEYGFIDKEIITQKTLMVLPNIPRFFRQGDTIVFPVKISNLSDEKISGNTVLQFFETLSSDTLKNLIIDKQIIKPFTIDANGNTLVNWKLKIPDDIQIVDYKIIAKAGNFSDAQQDVIPVLSNRMLVTESMPLPIRKKGTKNFTFDKLINSKKSKTLQNYKLTLEFTQNPAWYAIQALPYLMEPNNESSQNIFSRYYANILASHIVNSSPKIKKIFDHWRDSQTSIELLSNLEKNQELKSLLLKETPWVLNAENESQRKKQIALFFQVNKMSNELNNALNKLKKMQTANGGWSWFDGMPESRYITQNIVSGFGHLLKLNVINDDDAELKNMLTKAITYLDNRINDDYKKLKKYYKGKKLDKKHISGIQINYLYARSFFNNIPINKDNQEAFNYYKNQAAKFWTQNNKYLQGMTALALYRYDDKKTPYDIIKSLNEYAQHSDEMGMYWKDVSLGYYWYQAPIETQALMIELYNEVAKDDLAVKDLQVWLLKQKQTQDWRTPKATVEAVYALLLQGTDMLTSENEVKISLGDIKIEAEKSNLIKQEKGTGYFKTSWSKNEIKPQMGNVTLTSNDDHLAWGAVYWQYFEQLDKITSHKTPLSITKKLFIEKKTKSGKVIEPVGNTKLKVGNKVIVRIEIRVDRQMEYVHMKDMRAACFEPVNVISRYKYQEGLGYYETTKDASTDFFFSYLPKGSYVFEYPLRVNFKGSFISGITTLQCMYAPEFSSHSEGFKVGVGE